jgi:hypothetical protein
MANWGGVPKVALSVVFLAPKYDKNYANSTGVRKTKITNLDRNDAESTRQPAIMTKSLSTRTVLHSMTMDDMVNRN